MNKPKRPQYMNNSYESPEVTIIEVAIEYGFVSTVEDDPFGDGDGDVVFPE